MGGMMSEGITGGEDGILANQMFQAILASIAAVGLKRTMDGS